MNRQYAKLVVVGVATIPELPSNCGYSGSSVPLIRD
ncbi:Mycobacterium numidiamassiliense ORFan [Mycobacterium numidiamassiliense]|jgi:hypothetical protein|uniref:Mycobacterium numidiamassiliense ORFan n=1 Tax=Mycobacterium numidiamassiliense TaxID=1841861 RepID=A0A2U3PFA4_9MYCO|nr:Mycobacterium numidiamassiliense ORFan [Mycobacterium numidiamassiliense]